MITKRVYPYGVIHMRNLNGIMEKPFLTIKSLLCRSLKSIVKLVFVKRHLSWIRFKLIYQD